MSRGTDRQTDGEIAEEVPAGRRCCTGPPPGCMAGALHSQSDTCNATTMHPHEGRGHLPRGLGGHLVLPCGSSPCRWCPWAGCRAPGSPAGSCWPSRSGSGWPGSHPACSAWPGRHGRHAGQRGAGASCKAGDTVTADPLLGTIVSPFSRHGAAQPRCSVCQQGLCQPKKDGTCAISCHPCLSLMSPALTQSSAAPGAWSPPAGRGARLPPRLRVASE